MASLACFRGRLVPALRHIFVPLGLSLAGLVSLTGCGSTTTTLPSQANPLDSEENALILALNTLRTQSSLPTVKVCSSLNVSASAHSDDMRDNGYFGDIPPTDPTSTVRTRGCAAGYKPACTGTIPMAELVDQGSGSGVGTGAQTLAQWSADPTAGPILRQADLIVGGVGRSIGNDSELWTLDLASQDDPSCD